MPVPSSLRSLGGAPSSFGSVGAMPRVAATNRRQRRDARSPLAPPADLPSWSEPPHADGSVMGATFTSSDAAVERSRALLRAMGGGERETFRRPADAFPRLQARGEPRLTVDVTPSTCEALTQSRTSSCDILSNEEAASLLLDLSPRAQSPAPLLNSVTASPSMSSMAPPALPMSRCPSLLSESGDILPSARRPMSSGRPPRSVSRLSSPAPAGGAPAGSTSHTQLSDLKLGGLTGVPMSRDISGISIGGICSMLGDE